MKEKRNLNRAQKNILGTEPIKDDERKQPPIDLRVSLKGDVKRRKLPKEQEEKRLRLEERSRELLQVILKNLGPPTDKQKKEQQKKQ